VADDIPAAVTELALETTYRISLAGPIERMMDEVGDDSPDLFVVALRNADRVGLAASAAQHAETEWIAWNLEDDPDIATAAYEAGARAVLPAKVTPAGFARTVNAAQPPSQQNSEDVANTQVYRRGERLHLPATQVLFVRSGAVAQTVDHNDGSESLTGIFGPGRIVLQTSATRPVLTAHTDLTAEIRSWAVCASDPQFVERVRIELDDAQAWASVRSHPHVKQRLLGLLKLLTNSFGVHHPNGTLVDLNLTHEQLAAAVGTNRATMSRHTAALRRRGELSTVKVAGRRRFLLPNPSQRAELRAGDHSGAWSPQLI
jgi:CRP-like cAMP-binding protein